MLSKNRTMGKNVQKISKKHFSRYWHVTSFRFMSKNDLQGRKFLFFIFSNHVFWRQFKGQKVGGGKDFSNRCTMGWTIIFFWFFSKKVVIMYYGENPLFLKIGFPMGWTIIFFWFFSKKVVIMYYGENPLFLKIGFPMGWTIIFLFFFDVKNVTVYYGENTLFERIRDLITSWKQTLSVYAIGLPQGNKHSNLSRMVLIRCSMVL